MQIRCLIESNANDTSKLYIQIKYPFYAPILCVLEYFTNISMIVFFINILLCIFKPNYSHYKTVSLSKQ